MPEDYRVSISKNEIKLQLILTFVIKFIKLHLNGNSSLFFTQLRKRFQSRGDNRYTNIRMVI